VVVALALSAACTTTYRITVDGATLHHQAAALATRGIAVVDADETREEQQGDSTSHQIAQPVAIDRTVIDHLGRTRWVRDLLRGCSPTDFSLAANPDCELVAPGAFYEVRRYERHNYKRFAQVALVGTLVATVAGAAVCAEACKDGTAIHTASEYTAGIAATALVGALVWAIADCIGHWGEPGCRD
jgi:hypothetical protein